MDLTLRQYEDLNVTLNSVADGLLDGQDVLNVLGMKERVEDLEQYLADLIEEEGSLPEGEFDLFELCGSCNGLLVWCPNTFDADREAPPRGYRHVHTGLPDCDE